jgi:hypothetical protein
MYLDGYQDDLKICLNDRKVKVFDKKALITGDRRRIA